MMSPIVRKRMITAITVIFGASFLFGTVSQIAASFQVTPQQHLAQAESHMQNQEWEPALAELSEAEKALPKDPKIALLQGHALRLQGKSQEAIVKYDRVQELNPSDYEAYKYEAQLYRKLKRQDKYEQAIQEGLKVLPGHPVLETQQGILLGQKGKAAEAEAAFRKVIQTNANFPDAHFNLGALLQQQGKDKAAYAELTRYLQLRPDAPEKERILSWVEANRSALGQ